LALKPMDIWTGVKNYNFYISVSGGGVSGQAGAVSHSLARVILKLNENSKATLKKEGLLTRDARMVERKKPGRPKARKRFQFSKR
jgi:small subunit ribosomal protein S9